MFKYIILITISLFYAVLLKKKNVSLIAIENEQFFLFLCALCIKNMG